jgi:iron complex transport system permease protein
MTAPCIAAGKPVFWVAILSGTLLCLMVAATGMGFIPVEPATVLSVLAERVWGAEPFSNPMISEVIFNVRLPRIITAAAAGFGLAVAGTAFQGVLLNPLAEPFTLGVSSGAAFGASLALLLGLDFAGVWSVGACAFIGAATTLLGVMAIAGSTHRLSPTNLILSGVIVSAMLSAGISFMKYMADERVSVIIYWLMGSFAAKTWAEALLAVIVAGVGLAACLFLARDMNIMSMGDTTARSLGVNTEMTRAALLGIATFMAAACVAVSGIIGFVGLIVPHLMRLACGPDNRLLLPASGLGGAILLLGADTLTRAVLPHEVPVGVLTALIGGPVFCFIFSRKLARR